MAQSPGPAGRQTGDRPGMGPVRIPADRRPVPISDIIPIGPNLLAALASFIALLCAPWVALNLLHAVRQQDVAMDRVASLFLLADLRDLLLNAAAGALAFLLIGVVLQVWQSHRPFPAWWPVLLAFAVAWGLLVPESLLQGGSVVSGAVVASALALAFAMHWVVLIVLCDAMD